MQTQQRWTLFFPVDRTVDPFDFTSLTGENSFKPVLLFHRIEKRMQRKWETSARFRCTVLRALKKKKMHPRAPNDTSSPRDCGMPSMLWT